MTYINWSILSNDLSALIFFLVLWLFTRSPTVMWGTLVYAIAVFMWHI